MGLLRSLLRLLLGRWRVVRGEVGVRRVIGLMRRCLWVE
jgi:hypothetical protein